MKAEKRRSLLRNLSQLITLTYPETKLPQHQDYFPKYYSLPKERLIKHFLDQAKVLGFQPDDYGLRWSVGPEVSLTTAGSPEAYLSLMNVRAYRSSAPVVLSQEERDRAEFRGIKALVERGMRDAQSVFRHKWAQIRASSTEKQTFSAINLPFRRENQRIMRGVMHLEDIDRSQDACVELYRGFYLRD